MYFPKLEAMMGLAGIVLWSLVFWGLGVVVAVQAYTEWVWALAKPHATWHSMAWPCLLSLVALILVIQGGRGGFLLWAVARGSTTMRLARRDYWDVVPNFIVFIKTGVWRN